MQFAYQPWPWYLTGAVIGITVPLLLLAGNKRLGISSSLRHLCAACLPVRNIPLFNYDWKNEVWSLFFIGGILIGGFIGGYIFKNPDAVGLAPETIAYLNSLGVDVNRGELLPRGIFNWDSLLTLKGSIMIVVGGFMVGFGTRYAQGCTSGHGIFGLATLQWPSLVATCCFFIGGILFSYFILPYILTL